MTNLPGIRTAVWLHATWSVLAVGLFLASGVTGYFALMASVAAATSPGDSFAVRLLRSEVLSPQRQRSHPPGNSLPPFPAWWGYAVRLEVEWPLSADGAPEPLSGQMLPEPSSAGTRTGNRGLREIVVVPALPLKWVAERMELSLNKSAMVEVYRDGMQADLLRVREQGQSGEMILSILCAILGVLCLAISLRYQPDRLTAAAIAPGPPATTSPAPPAVARLFPRS